MDKPNLKFNSLAVFCGSNTGGSVYIEAAHALGQAIAEQGITLIYGGARVGTMGALADAALKKNGKVIGVIPQKIVDIEVAHKNLSELHVVNSMHERKALMAQLSDGFIMLPGGAGSIDEFFEMYTWAQLHYHQKPCGILNINNFFDHLLKFLDVMVTEKFLREENRDMIQVDHCAHNLLKKFSQYIPPNVSKWIG